MFVNVLLHKNTFAEKELKAQSITKSGKLGKMQIEKKQILKVHDSMQISKKLKIYWNKS